MAFFINIYLKPKFKLIIYDFLVINDRLGKCQIARTDNIAQNTYAKKKLHRLKFLSYFFLTILFLTLGQYFLFCCSCLLIEFLYFLTINFTLNLTVIFLLFISFHIFLLFLFLSFFYSHCYTLIT